MEKIVLVLNAHRPDTASIDFACWIAKLTAAKLTGLLIDEVYAAEAPVFMAESSYFDLTLCGETQAGVATETDRAVKLFLDECHLKKVAASICVVKGEPMQQVIAESRFADLLVIDSAMHFYKEELLLPSHFTKEVLAHAECPVLLAPAMFHDIDEIVFCYDGSASSVFAIKQLTYLFPSFADKNVLLLEVSRLHSRELDEDHRNMLEWLQAHYKAVCYQTLKGTVKDELFTFFFMKTRKLVVMGAYGRSSISTFFKRSSADVLIRTVDLPLFITHH